MKSPFYTKEYDSYEKYLDQQISKLDSNPSWLDSYLNIYDKWLTGFLTAAKLDFKNTSTLCIGARTGKEVEVFCRFGSFAIGIDVNTGKDNKWVVTGDASQIQYPDSCVDVVYTNVLDHLLKIEESLDEIVRVLKPKGCFLLLIGTPEDAKKDKWGSTYWDSVDDVLAYLKEKHNLMTIKRFNVKFTNWFSDFVVLKKGVE